VWDIETKLKFCPWRKRGQNEMEKTIQLLERLDEQGVMLEFPEIINPS